MNALIPIANVDIGSMTNEGQILIPKTLRDRAGLKPGGEVTVGINEDGDIVIRPRRAKETADERAARVRTSIESVRGTLDTGFATTDDYMDFIRPHRHRDW